MHLGDVHLQLCHWLALLTSLTHCTYCESDTLLSCVVVHNALAWLYILVAQLLVAWLVLVVSIIK